MKFFAAVIALLLYSSFAFAQSTPRPYRVAVIVPLSGQVASLGSYVKRGIDLAYENLPPEQREKLVLVYEDDQFDPVKTLSGYRTLKQQGPVDAVFVLGSPPANALGPITERDRTILIGVGASDPTIAVGKKFSFLHWVTPTALGEVLAEELKQRDFKRIGFVTAEASGTVADTAAAMTAMKARDFQERVVYRETFLKGETDYRAVVAALKAKQVDAVVAVLFPGALSAFAKQLKSARLPAELIGMETFEDEAEVKASEGAMLGAWYVNASDPTERFVAEYKQKYGEHPGWAAANGYDSLRLIANAAAAVGNDSVKVANYLSETHEYAGAAGTYSATGDNRFTLPAALKRVTERGFEPLSRESH